MGNSKRRISVKRKRQFRGNGFIKNDSKNSTVTANASALKLNLSAILDEEIAEYENKPLTGNRIIDIELLLCSILQLCCPKCFHDGLLLHEDSRYGLCSSFAIKCKHCDFCTGFSSSKKLS
ncbi:uncharacterized protein NPIL_384751 [Nephila pilipes]|uniref:Uncharacterized protein n=1 Tax=Nephila pilipes TaxID=299642 RepID=A0A8X6MP86_NEPPI|nr:uncharacterized protein NPIL_384751 [Nephila pilipes]